MPLKTPNFWQNDSLISKFLTPFSSLYDIGQKMDGIITVSYKSTLPVLCVGGVVAGGSGKTPVLHALLSLIREHQIFSNPVILTRGYGGRISKSTIVDLQAHTYQDVGDEALLHARHAVTIIGRNRMESAKLAESIGADCILMDDGLQNKKLDKNMSVLVIDSVQGLGNGRLLPAGPLRENINDVLERVCAIVEVGESDLFFPQKPVIKSSIRVLSNHNQGDPYVAFAGLGYPEKFRQTLLKCNFALQDFITFADHHPYTVADMQKIRDAAQNSKIITTAKDYVRIPLEHRDGIEILEIAIAFENPDLVTDMIRENLAGQ